MTRYSERTGLPQTYQVGPFDSSHIYVQWGGKLPGNETWSCGFRMWKSGGSTVADTTPLAISVSEAIRAYHVRTTSQISAAAKLQFVKVNAVGTDGRYLSDFTTQVIYGDVPGGGATVAPHPNQVALAITLLTGFNRGPAHKGRFYMPLPNFLPGADGLITDSDRDFARTSAAGLRSDVNTNETGHVMAIMSRKAGAPGHRAVTAIEVGRALDTQRRRRRSLVEDYQ